MSVPQKMVNPVRNVDAHINPHLFGPHLVHNSYDNNLEHRIYDINLIGR